MTREEKQLLFKDLCGRLPYGVVVRCTDSDTDYKCFLTTDILHEIQNGYEYYDYRPYLRPLSSMTEEEEAEFNQIFELELKALESPEGHTIESAASAAFEIDFYNKHHIDYRGLIPMGLAVEATKDMYKIE